MPREKVRHVELFGEKSTDVNLTETFCKCFVELSDLFKCRFRSSQRELFGSRRISVEC